MVVCVNRNLVTGMPPSVSKAVTNQNDLAAGQLYSFSLFEKRPLIFRYRSQFKQRVSKNVMEESISVFDWFLRLGITVGAKFRRGSDHFNLPFPGSIQSYRFLRLLLNPRLNLAFVMTWRKTYALNGRSLLTWFGAAFDQNTPADSSR